MNVLVVDDEPLLLEIWQGLFDLLGWQVTTAHGGHDAVAVLSERSFDVVITDLKMGEGDGFVVLEYLKKEAPPGVVNIVCSGYIDDEDNMLGAYEIERIIRKPFSLEAELEYFRKLESL